MNLLLDLIKKIEHNGGKLIAEKGSLIIDAPEQVLNETLAKLKAYKQEVLKLLALKKLVNLIGAYYAVDTDEIDEMFEQTLKHHSIQKALLTFNNLAAQLNIKQQDYVSKSASYPELVQCSNCNHFKHDTIGNSEGIGECTINAWQESQPALYPPIKRVCKQFQLTNNEELSHDC